MSCSDQTPMQFYGLHTADSQSLNFTNSPLLITKIKKKKIETKLNFRI